MTALSARCGCKDASAGHGRGRRTIAREPRLIFFTKSKPSLPSAGPGLRAPAPRPAGPEPAYTVAAHPPPSPESAGPGGLPEEASAPPGALRSPAFSVGGRPTTDPPGEPGEPASPGGSGRDRGGHPRRVAGVAAGGRWPPRAAAAGLPAGAHAPGRREPGLLAVCGSLGARLGEPASGGRAESPMAGG